MQNKNIILIDADAVLLDWLGGFCKWAVNEKGLVLKKDHTLHYAIEDKFEDSLLNTGYELLQEFNRSEALETLDPIPESQKYIKRLASHRYKFHVITSIETTPEIITRRKNNLLNAFGDVFLEITCVGNGLSKTDTLKKYINTQQWWIEDHPKNALEGYNLGLRTVLINYPYNKDFRHPGIYRCDDWEQIYKLISEY